MNYDKIIIELLDRIKELEERVDALEKDKRVDEFHDMRNRKVTLVDLATEYIDGVKAKAKENGENSITLLCNDIQIALGVTNRTPSICKAMYECMNEENGDHIVSAPPSGKSTTVKVEYFLH